MKMKDASIVRGDGGGVCIIMQFVLVWDLGTL